MELSAYLARIGFAGTPAPDLPTLTALARLQPQAIAFENLGPAMGEVPSLDPAALAAKMLGRRRGGYCHELNGLLLAALRAIGFAVTVLSARVRYRVPPERLTGRGHMLLLVTLPEGRFIADAGFGGLTLTAPLALAEGAQATPHETMRLLAEGADHRLQARLGEAWEDVYRFDLSPQLPPDIAMQNWFAATAPGSLFGSTVLATRPVAGGRWALMNRTLTWRPTGGAPERRELANAVALRAALADVFGLEVAEEEAARLDAVAAASTARLETFT